MAARALLVALCFVAAGLVSCGSADHRAGSGAGDRAASGAGGKRTPAPADPAPLAATGGGASYAAPPPDPVVRRANRRCRRSVRAVHSGAAIRSLAERAADVRRERARLLRIRRALVAAAGGRLSPDLRRYRAALKDQMFLDGRIERAAKEGDVAAVAVGLRQNRYNERRRRQIADEVGLFACR
jgi:hypothetical protein